ncbi:MAG: nucleotidyltransferase family protein [archaeon]|nr:nucleotidyltransferase family protein [archaeon]
MTYTEIQKRNGEEYYYRVLSIRSGKKVNKKKIYLGKNLSKLDLRGKEDLADKEILKDRIQKHIVLIKSKILDILKKNNIKRAGIFGSYARGEQKKNSDIDLLIEPARGMGFGFFGMNDLLEKKLGKKVHLVTYKYINPRIKKNILNDEIRII